MRSGPASASVPAAWAISSVSSATVLPGCAGDPAARHVNAKPLGRVVVELRLGHAVDRRDDQADARARLGEFSGKAVLLCPGVHVSRSFYCTDNPTLLAKAPQ